MSHGAYRAAPSPVIRAAFAPLGEYPRRDQEAAAKRTAARGSRARGSLDLGRCAKVDEIGQRMKDGPEAYADQGRKLELLFDDEELRDD